MASTFDPNNSQPDYGVHDVSMMVDDAEVVPGASKPTNNGSSPVGPRQSDDEYATPPHHKIPIEDVDAMMSIYDESAATPSSRNMEGKAHSAHALRRADTLSRSRPLVGWGRYRSVPTAGYPCRYQC